MVLLPVEKSRATAPIVGVVGPARGTRGQTRSQHIRRSRAAAVVVGARGWRDREKVQGREGKPSSVGGLAGALQEMQKMRPRYSR